jgi:hypothetical protein
LLLHALHDAFCANLLVNVQARVGQTQDHKNTPN